MRAVVWSDYLCPWCYLGTTRTALLEDLGVTVETLPFELHPEVPEGGRELGTRGRRVYERVGALARDAGLAFRTPDVLPNTRRVLETSEWVRTNDRRAFRSFHDAVFRSFFVDGRHIGEPEVIDDLVDEAGADAAAARAAVEAGVMRAAVDAHREAAIDAGATGAPSWYLADRLLIAGVQDPEVYERFVVRLGERLG